MRFSIAALVPSSGVDPDGCPNEFGTSLWPALGCPDLDEDGWADTDDDEAPPLTLLERFALLCAAPFVHEPELTLPGLAHVAAGRDPLELDFPIGAFDELLIRVGKGEGSPSGFARVMSASAERARAVFSSPSPALRDWLAATQQHEQGQP